MKTLANSKTTLSADGKSVTITADVLDAPWSEFLVTRVTHGHLNPANPRHHRHIQSSNAAVFVRAGRNTFAIPNDVLVAIAANIEPATGFAPLFKKGTLPPKVDVISETAVTFKWQVSDNAFPLADKPHTPPPVVAWTDIVGQTTNTLDEASVKVGQWIRCIASNASGTTISQPAQKK